MFQKRAKSISSKTNKLDKGAGLLVTPQLISVQGFAFRGRPMSLLVSCAPAGSHPFRFPCRSLRLVLQSTARTNYTHKIYIQHNNKKTRTTNQKIINSSHLTSTEILLSQPHFYYLFNLFFYDLFFS